MEEIFRVPGFVQKVRKTSDTPPRISVYDLIDYITGTVKQSVNLLKRMKLTESERVSLGQPFKFPGRGGNVTPVTDARGAVKIMNLLQGAAAARFRDLSADIVVRYIGGDETLVAEVLRNRELQETLPASHPLRVFGEDVESRALPALVSVTRNLLDPEALTSTAVPGLYFTRYGNKLSVSGLPDGAIVVGFGISGNYPRRHGEHGGMTGSCELLDFFPTYNGKVIEDLLKEQLKVQNRKCKGLVEGRDGYITELFWVAKEHAQVEYQVVVESVQRYIVDNPHPLENGLVRLEMEMKMSVAASDARKAEAEAQARVAEAQAQARVAEAEAGARKAEAEAQAQARVAEAEADVRKTEASVKMREMEYAAVHQNEQAEEAPAKVDEMVEPAAAEDASAKVLWQETGVQDQCRVDGFQLYGGIHIEVAEPRVQSLDPTGAVLGTYQSVSEAARVADVPRDVIYSALGKVQKPLWRRSHEKVCYRGMRRRAWNHSGARVWLLTKENRKVALFPSSHQLADVLGLSRPAISNAIKMGTLLRGAMRAILA